MRSGRLRHEITIERLTNAATELDSRGQQAESWGTLARVRASVEPLQGTEAQIARQQYATATHLVRCRYVAGVTEQCRIQFRGRTLHVNEVRNDLEKDRELFITASEEKP